MLRINVHNKIPSHNFTAPLACKRKILRFNVCQGTRKSISLSFGGAVEASPQALQFARPACPQTILIALPQ